MLATLGATSNQESATDLFRLIRACLRSSGLSSSNRVSSPAAELIVAATIGPRLRQAPPDHTGALLTVHKQRCLTRLRGQCQLRVNFGASPNATVVPASPEPPARPTSVATPAAAACLSP